MNTRHEPGAELPIRELRDAMGPWVESCDLHYVTGGPRPGYTVELTIRLFSSQTWSSDAHYRRGMLAQAETYIETALGLGWVFDTNPPKIELGGDAIVTTGGDISQILHEGRLELTLRWPS